MPHLYGYAAREEILRIIRLTEEHGGPLSPAEIASIVTGQVDDLSGIVDSVAARLNLDVHSRSIKFNR